MKREIQSNGLTALVTENDNDHQTLGRIIDYLRKVGINHEFIFKDDETKPDQLVTFRS